MTLRRPAWYRPPSADPCREASATRAELALARERAEIERAAAAHDYDALHFHARRAAALSRAIAHGAA